MRFPDPPISASTSASGRSTSPSAASSSRRRGCRRAGLAPCWRTHRLLIADDHPLSRRLLIADDHPLSRRVLEESARQLGWTPTLHNVVGSVPRLLEEFRSERR